MCVLGWVLVGEPDVDLSCGAWGTEGSCGGRGRYRCRAGEEADADRWGGWGRCIAVCFYRRVALPEQVNLGFVGIRTVPSVNIYLASVLATVLGTRVPE